MQVLKHAIIIITFSKKKKSCTCHGKGRHNMPQPFRCTNAAVVINVYEFQKDEKQEKEAQGRDTILILKLSSEEKQKLVLNEECLYQNKINSEILRKEAKGPYMVVEL